MRKLDRLEIEAEGSISFRTCLSLFSDALNIHLKFVTQLLHLILPVRNLGSCELVRVNDQCMGLNLIEYGISDVRPGKTWAEYAARKD